MRPVIDRLSKALSPDEREALAILDAEAWQAVEAAQQALAMLTGIDAIVDGYESLLDVAGATASMALAVLRGEALDPVIRAGIVERLERLVREQPTRRAGVTAVRAQMTHSRAAIQQLNPNGVSRLN